MNIAISALAIAGRAIYYVSCYVVAARVLGYALDWNGEYRRKKRLAAFAAKQAAFENHTLPEDIEMEFNADDNATDSWGQEYVTASGRPPAVDKLKVKFKGESK